MLVTHKLLADSLPSKEVDANLLNTLPVVSYNTQLPLIREYFDVVFKAHCRSQIIATCPDIRALAGIVRTGVGYSVLPDYLCYEDLRTGRLVRLGPEGPENNIYLAWRKGALAHPRVNYARDIMMAIALGEHPVGASPPSRGSSRGVRRWVRGGRLLDRPDDIPEPAS